MVGTANSIVPPSAIAAQTGSGEKRCSSRSVPPTRSDPSTPRTSPCTWNSGRAWTSTSRSVQPQAPASASRSNAAARVGDHRALRRAGRPGRVEDEERVVRGGGGRERARGAVGRDGGDGGRAGAERGGIRREHEARRGVGEHVAELSLPDRRVERHGRDAEERVPDHRGEGGQLRRRPERDAVAPPDPFGAEPGGVRAGRPAPGRRTRRSRRRCGSRSGRRARRDRRGGGARVQCTGVAGARGRGGTKPSSGRAGRTLPRPRDGHGPTRLRTRR